MNLKLPRVLLASTMLALAGLSVPLHDAAAQTQACSPYSHADWLSSMDRADAKLAEFDIDGARKELGEIQKKLRCLDTIAKPSYLSRFARQISLIFFFDQDEDTTRRWGLLSRYTYAELPWPKDFPSDHPFREALEFADDPPMGGPTDKGLLVPSKGGIFMNGQLLTAPQARAEVPALVQVADKKGVIIDAFWQDGAAFPDHILGAPGPAPIAPKWYVPEDLGSSAAVADADQSLFGLEDEPGTGEPGTTEPTPKPDPEPVTTKPDPEPVATKPDPEPEKPPKPAKVREPGSGALAKIPVPQVAISGGLAIAAGTLYAIGAATRPGIYDASDPDELASVRGKTNLLALGAGVTGLAAVGVGVTAFLSDDTTVIGVHGKF